MYPGIINVYIYIYIYNISIYIYIHIYLYLFLAILYAGIIHTRLCNMLTKLQQTTNNYISFHKAETDGYRDMRNY